MILFLLALFGLASSAAVSPPSQHLAPFQLDGSAKRAGPARPVNIDLSVWRPGKTDLQWSGDVFVGTPPQKLSVVLLKERAFGNMD
jgi:hypothetical protein